MKSRQQEFIIDFNYDDYTLGNVNWKAEKEKG